MTQKTLRNSLLTLFMAILMPHIGLNVNGYNHMIYADKEETRLEKSIKILNKI